MKRFVISGVGRICALLIVAALISAFTRVGTEAADIAAICLAVVGVVIVFSPATPRERRTGHSYGSWRRPQ